MFKCKVTLGYPVYWVPKIYKNTYTFGMIINFNTLFINDV